MPVRCRSDCADGENLCVVRLTRYMEGGESHTVAHTLALRKRAHTICDPPVPRTVSNAESLHHRYIYYCTIVIGLLTTL